MFAKSKVSGKEILLSVLLGAGAAVISVFLLWNGVAVVNDKKTLLPVSDTTREAVVFYATQHGAFSNAEAAGTLQKQHVSLNQSVIFEQDGVFYLWSGLNVVKTATETVPTSFSKKLAVDSNACTEAGIAAIPELLANDKALKKNYSTSEIPADWQQQIEAISSLSQDLTVLRLLLLEHYLQQQDCLNIKFES